MCGIWLVAIMQAFWPFTCLHSVFARESQFSWLCCLIYSSRPGFYRMLMGVCGHFHCSLSLSVDSFVNLHKVGYYLGWKEWSDTPCLDVLIAPLVAQLECKHFVVLRERHRLLSSGFCLCVCSWLLVGLLAFEMCSQLVLIHRLRSFQDVLMKHETCSAYFWAGCVDCSVLVFSSFTLVVRHGMLSSICFHLSLAIKLTFNFWFVLVLLWSWFLLSVLPLNPKQHFGSWMWISVSEI